MAKIAYILLCHKDPQGVIDQAGRLTAAGDFMAIHFDARASKADYEAIRTALAGNPSVVFAQRRIRCGWGEWSLVQATLEALYAAVPAFPRATHFYMLSGDCMSIKSAEYAHALLDGESVDYIESFDFFASDWIKTGIREERLIYRHWFNERGRKAWFYRSLEWQKKLGLARKIPEDLQIMIGSQWWCLRRLTVEKLLQFVAARPDVTRFFRTTWIPDETFFQTLVRHLVPGSEIRSRTLTFLMFTDYGMPVTFYDDHYDLLLAQDYLFARKLSVDARRLKEQLGSLYTATGMAFPVSGEGRRLYQFQAGRGRLGRRYAPRAWEAGTSLGRDRVLLIVVCKKWHIAKRLVARAREMAGIEGVDYLFNEDNCPLPDLGGIESTPDKRMRHRRALLKLLSESFRSDRMMICLDPESFDLIRDFYADRSEIRLLDIVCDFSDAYLRGHALRVGLAGEHTPPEVMAGLLPTLRHDMIFEAERLRDAGLPGYERVWQSAEPGANLLPLARFLGISEAQAREILGDGTLFKD